MCESGAEVWCRCSGVGGGGSWAGAWCASWPELAGWCCFVSSVRVIPFGLGNLVPILTPAGGSASFAAALTLWALGEAERCGELIVQHAMDAADAIAPAAALRTAAECCRLAGTHCAALEAESQLSVETAALPPMHARLLATLAAAERRAAEQVSLPRVTRRDRWLTLRARWVTLRACWVTLRDRWVMLRAS